LLTCPAASRSPHRTDSDSVCTCRAESGRDEGGESMETRSGEEQTGHKADASRETLVIPNPVAGFTASVGLRPLVGLDVRTYRGMEGEYVHTSTPTVVGTCTFRPPHPNGACGVRMTRTQRGRESVFRGPTGDPKQKGPPQTWDGPRRSGSRLRRRSRC